MKKAKEYEVPYEFLEIDEVQNYKGYMARWVKKPVLIIEGIPEGKSMSAAYIFSTLTLTKEFSTKEKLIELFKAEIDDLTKKTK